MMTLPFWFRPWTIRFIWHLNQGIHWLVSDWRHFRYLIAALGLIQMGYAFTLNQLTLDLVGGTLLGYFGAFGLYRSLLVRHSNNVLEVRGFSHSLSQSVLDIRPYWELNSLDPILRQQCFELFYGELEAALLHLPPHPTRRWVIRSHPKVIRTLLQSEKLAKRFDWTLRESTRHYRYTSEFLALIDKDRLMAWCQVDPQGSYQRFFCPRPLLILECRFKSAKQEEQ